MPLNSFVNRSYKTLYERKVLLVYIPLAIYWVVIFIATTIPVDKMPKLFIAQDKLEHFAAYFFLEILLALTFHFQNKSEFLKQKPIFFSIAVLIIYAAFDEIHQYFIPGRYADVLDWVADVIGGLFAIILVKWFLKKTSSLHLTME
jgi:VanZ family protein